MNYTDEQLFNLGLIRDRRRRFVLPDANQTSGKHIAANDMKKFSILSSKRMFVSLFFILNLGILKQSVTLSLGIAALIALGAWIYETKFLEPRMSPLKLSEAEIKTLNSLPFLKATRSNYMTDFVLMVIVLALTFYYSIENSIPDLKDKASLVVVSVYCAAMAARYFYKWWLTRKHIKTLSKK